MKTKLIKKINIVCKNIKHFCCIFLFLTTYAYGKNFIQGSGVASASAIMGMFSDPNIIPKSWNLPSLQYDGHVGALGASYQLNSKTVDFVAVLIPQTSKQLKKLNAVQIPLAIGGIVPVVNLPGVRPNEMVLSGEILYNIFAGNISYWDDPHILALNPNIKLSHKQILIIYPVPGSAIAYEISHYINDVNSHWSSISNVGYNINWPNAGIISYANNIDSYLNVLWEVQRLPYSIGFSDYYYIPLLESRKFNNFVPVSMLNPASNISVASFNTFSSAASFGNFNASKDYYTFIDNTAGKKAWPLSTVLYIIIPLNHPTSAKTLSFFLWVLSSARPSFWERFGYTPMPRALVKNIENYTANNIIAYNKIHMKTPIFLEQRFVNPAVVNKISNAYNLQKIRAQSTQVKKSKKISIKNTAKIKQKKKESTRFSRANTQRRTAPQNPQRNVPNPQNTNTQRRTAPQNLQRNVPNSQNTNTK